MAVKYSRQREMIYNFLMTRKDHPTADVVYKNIRQEYPNISLGTVYRNLTLLADRGDIRRLHVGDGVDHFDADTSRHCHFVCSNCSAVTDMPFDYSEEIFAKAQQTFDGRIDNQSICFYGICEKCLDKSVENNE